MLVRRALFALLAANGIVVAYLVFFGAAGSEASDPRTREIKAKQVKIIHVGPAREPAPAAVASASTQPASAVASARTEPGTSTSAAAAPAACLEWGTFSPGELARAQAQLAELEPGRSRVRELGLGPAWWVYVPPLGSREEAEQRALEIEQAGVRGVRVVSESERWRNAISLGFFKTEEAALAHLARMRAARVQKAAVVQRNNLLRLASIVIVEPSPGLVGRLTELQAAFAGTVLGAIACPPAD